MNDNVHMLPQGKIADDCKFDPTIYRKHKWQNKQGKLMLYLQLKKTIWNIRGSDTVL